MRRMLFVLMLAAILAMAGQAVAESFLVLNNTPAEVYFSPDGGAQDAIVREIGKAKSSILVQA